MSTNMLIDAAHPEETRVVVVRDGKVEEFDFEAASRKQLRGNIYLAKVTRVEPSLQAAFVDYGGNRHGFLAFSEIHPDYYQIPYADRQALIAEEAEAASQDSEDGDGPEDGAGGSADDNGNGTLESSGTVEEVASGADENVEAVGGDDALEEVPARRGRPRRSYKIQEVIKKRQVLLVQVVKEERGNKGAALTTYLSLAGRYSVLMPNTGRGGGISRKITNAADRKRLKNIVSSLDVPEGMGVILRTAGAARTKAEVKRDFEYLLRLWENVRELTLESVAPTLVYEEGSLVKRAIRDLYTKNISKILVSGDAAYREAKDFMRMLMPSHAKNVQPYREEQPVFFKHDVEGQLDAMFSPHVTLKSGGYIVINQTEALVSIDVNSGRSTREHNIEDTALKTNQEAADEIARQLRLRDLAGLIVIDFIDMDEKRNNRAVERRLKDALKNDRARIQVGRISHFGLLEMSRQRIRFGVLESSLHVCPQCEGAGYVRSVESVALHVLRSIEYELRRAAPTDLTVRVRTPVALYILNQKREHLRELEALGIDIRIESDEALNGTAFKIERGEPARPVDREAVVRPASVDPDQVEADAADETEEPPRKSRRKRRKRGGDAQEARSEGAETAETSGEAEARPEPQETAADDEGEGQPRRRRRGRRGGRRHRREAREETQATPASGQEDGGAETQPAQQAQPSEVSEPAESEEAVSTNRETATDEAPVSQDTGTGAAESQPAAEAAQDEAGEAETDAPAKPKRRAPRRKKAAAKAAEPAPAEDVASEPVETGATGEADSEPSQASEEGRPPVTGEIGATEAAPSEPAWERPVKPAEAEAEPAGAETPTGLAEAEHPAPEEAASQATSTTEDEEPKAAAEKTERPKRGWWQRRKLFGS